MVITGWSTAGSVFDIPFDFTVDVDVDVAPEPVKAAPTALFDGALRFEVPNSSSVEQPGDWESSSESSLDAESPLDTDVLDTIARFVNSEGNAGVLVLRSRRPVSHPDLDVAVEQLNDSLPRAGTITSAEVDGYRAKRIELSHEGVVLRIDIVPVDAEYFVIQSSAPVGDDSAFAEALTIADSVVFDTERFPRLTHWVPVITSADAFARRSAVSDERTCRA